MDSNVLTILSFAALVWWIDQEKRIALILAGVGAGLTTCFLQQKGVCLFAAFQVTIWLFARKWRPLGELALAYCAVGIVAVAWFASHGGLTDLIYATISWPLTTYSSINVVPYGLGFRELYWKAWTESLVPVFSPAIGFPMSVLLSMPLVAVLALPLWLGLLGSVLGKAAFARPTWPYWICGSALFISEMQRKDLAHVVYGSPILLLLVFYLSRNVRTRVATTVLHAIMVAAVALAILNPSVALLTQKRIATRRGVVYDSGTDPILEFLMSHTRTGEPIFIYPYASMYYFLTAAENPTRFNILMYNFHTNSHFREAVEALERRRVRYVVWDQKFPERAVTSFPGFRLPTYAGRVMEPYLTSHYQVVARGEDGFEVLERKD